MQRATVTITETMEPQVTSVDPNERKLARRLRIERRVGALRKSKCSASEVEATAEEERLNPIQAQLQKSAEILEKFLLDSEEFVTNVRVANDSREVNRREDEGLQKEKVMQDLAEEAQNAQKMFNEVAEKWEVIQKYNDPLHINEDITNQKEKCDMLIKQKDGIIAMLRDELKNAERTFTKDQRKQIEDIDILTRRIEKQISFMRRAYRHELDVIEDVILLERRELIQSTNAKWDELYEKREEQEVSNMKKKFEQLEEFVHRMTKLRIDFQEHYRETKIKLENDIDELQKELERIKALALLNSEKLDYNYQILKKREDENIIIKSQQKRKMNKLQDIINDLRGQIVEYESTTANKIKKLSDNIKKLHKSILEVETKADHFASVNDEKFHTVWEMNRKSALDVLKRILETDRILYSQQMGIDWEPPTNLIIDKRVMPSYKTALSVVDSKFLHITPEDRHILSKLKKTDSGISLRSKPSTGLIAKYSSYQQATAKESAKYRKLIKHLLVRISDKSGFLAESRLKVLLKGYEEDQKQLVKLTNVFAALDIQDPSYIDVLVQHFVPYTFCPVCCGTSLTTGNNESGFFSRSNCSQISVYASKPGDVDNQSITPELEMVVDAVRQTEDIFEAVVADLVSSEDLFDSSSLAETGQDMIEELCGGAIKEREQLQIDEKSVREKREKSRSKKPQGPKSSEHYLCQYDHPLVISSVYVLRALKEFVAACYVGKIGEPTIGNRLESRRITISRYLSKDEIGNYWEKFKQSFGEDRVRVWDALLAGLKKYNQILKDRKKLCDEVVALRKENYELKRLLGNYIDNIDATPLCK